MPDKSDHHDSGGEPDILRHTMPPRLKLFGRVALGAAVVIAAGGLALRYYDSRRTEAWTEDQAVPSVQIFHLKGAAAGGKLDLGGDIQAFTNAPIYAQVSGTVQKWYVDIGATVKQGDILAQLDPRSYQATLDQARGQLARDSATLANAKVDLARYQALAQQNAISNQALSAQQTAVNADTGIVAADQAAVQSAAINLEYTRIKAPFGGQVTSRSIDMGTLVVVGTASSTPLFTVTDLTKLRIYVRLPQIYMAAVKPGMGVDFNVPEYPGRTFTATLTAQAGAVTSNSGTQLLQFQTDNQNGTLKPGGYATMHFKLSSGNGVLRVPATALLYRDDGMMVATVDGNGHVRLKPITIRTDLGNAVDATGLTIDDQVIDNPSDSLDNGDVVKATPAPPPAADKE